LSRGENYGIWLLPLTAAWFFSGKQRGQGKKIIGTTSTLPYTVLLTNM
jgi:hypothetical protein